MTRRHPNEVVLARWVVPPEALREFVRSMRNRYGNTPFTPIDVLDACERHPPGGLEVVCREDAVFVGQWCLAFLYNQITGIALQDTWIRFEMEGGLYEIPVPIDPRQRAEAQGVVDLYNRMAEEETRRAVAARQAPTWNNALLDFAEAHFVWLALGFFFVGIPAIVLLAMLLSGKF